MLCPVRKQGGSVWLSRVAMRAGEHGRREESRIVGERGDAPIQCAHRGTPRHASRLRKETEPGISRLPAACADTFPEGEAARTLSIPIHHSAVAEDKSCLKCSVPHGSPPNAPTITDCLSIGYNGNTYRSESPIALKILWYLAFGKMQVLR